MGSSGILGENNLGGNWEIKVYAGVKEGKELGKQGRPYICANRQVVALRHAELVIWRKERPIFWLKFSSHIPGGEGLKEPSGW